MYLLLWGWLRFQEGLEEKVKRYVNIDAQKQWTELTFTIEAIGLGLDYPPCPAYLVIYNQIIIVCGNFWSLSLSRLLHSPLNLSGLYIAPFPEFTMFIPIVRRQTNASLWKICEKHNKIFSLSRMDKLGALLMYIKMFSSFFWMAILGWPKLLK